MSHALFYVVSRFVALGMLLILDVLWWRRALTSPPPQRRGNILVALIGLVPVVLTLLAIAFF
jgi:hypothetical protein